jgi:hypothetical protein
MPSAATRGDLHATRATELRPSEREHPGSVIGGSRLELEKQRSPVAPSPLFSELRNIVVKTVGLAEPLRSVLKPVSSAIRAAFVYGSVLLAASAERDRIFGLAVSRTALTDFPPLRKPRRFIYGVHPSRGLPPVAHALVASVSGSWWTRTSSVGTASCSGCGKLRP